MLDLNIRQSVRYFRLPFIIEEAYSAPIRFALGNVADLFMFFGEKKVMSSEG